LAACSADILEELKIEKAALPQVNIVDLQLTEEEKKVMNVLSHESLYIDIITKLTKLETATISGVLSILEIKGLVKNTGGQNYIKCQ
jgi:DNA processing protein